MEVDQHLPHIGTRVAGATHGRPPLLSPEQRVLHQVLGRRLIPGQEVGDTQQSVTVSGDEVVQPIRHTHVAPSDLGSLHK
jgi:hypothetical protein